MRMPLPLTLLGLVSCGSRSQEGPPGSGPKSVAESPERDIQVVPLKYASAGEIEKLLNDFLNSSAPDEKFESSLRIVADERTNSLLVQAPTKDLPRALALVGSLDRKVE